MNEEVNLPIDILAGSSSCGWNIESWKNLDLMRKIVEKEEAGVRENQKEVLIP
jgi:hypothetical protein